MANPRNNTTATLAQSLANPDLTEASSQVVFHTQEEKKSLPSRVKTSNEFVEKIDYALTNREAIRHTQMVKQGQIKFESYMQKRINESKKQGKDLFAKIDFESKDKDELLQDPDVKAYLRNKPEFKFEPLGKINFHEFKQGIGKPNKKGELTTPDILIMSTDEIEEIKLADHDINLDTLLANRGLEAIRYAGALLKDPQNPDLVQPLIVDHLSSGSDDAKKETRKNEIKVIEDIELALLKKYPQVYTDGDDQVNQVEISSDGEIKVADDTMVLNPELPEILAARQRDTVAELAMSKPKEKQRHAGLKGKFLGLSTESNQDKTVKDAGGKLQAKTIKAYNPEIDMPNSKVKQTLPSAGTQLIYATGTKSSDHEPVIVRKVNQGKKEARIVSGGIIQTGFKKFQALRESFNERAIVKNEQGNEVLSEEAYLADVKLVGKLFSLLTSNLVRAKIINPSETPSVDSIAIKEKDQKTSLGYMEEFYNSLAKINIDPIKSPKEIIASIDFNDVGLISRLAIELNKMGMQPIKSPEDMVEIFKAKDKTQARKLCFALNNMGIDPFKSEQDMMATFNSCDRVAAKKLSEAINKILQVQAVDNLEAQEEKKQEAPASFTQELRDAFRNALIQEQESEEFNEGYFPYTSEEHKKAHGYLEKTDLEFAPEELSAPIRAREQATFAANAEKFLAEANKKSPTQSRSPVQQMMQAMFNRERAGGYGVVANETPSSEKVILNVCVENALLYFGEHVNGASKITHSITETSTKGLGAQAKNGEVGALYTGVIMDMDRFYDACRRQSLQQKLAEENTRTSGNLYRMSASSSRPTASTAVMVDGPQQAPAASSLTR